MRFTSIIILLLLATPMAMHADTVELRWKEVRGSSGYLVRIRKADGQTIENRIGTNELRLDLDPGEYTIRIAGLNKFGKPGPFSDPAKVTVQASEQTQKIDVDAPAIKNKPEPSKEPDKKPEPEEQPPSVIYDPYSFSESLVPGLPQYSKQSYKIYAFNGLLLAHAFAGFREKQRGDAISRDPLNDPTGLLAVTSGQPVAFAYLWNRRAEQKRRYWQSQRTQTYIGVSALLIYALHFADLYWHTANPGLGYLEFSSAPDNNRPNWLSAPWQGQRASFGPEGRTTWDSTIQWRIPHQW